jgi:hypothetical protein
MYLVIGFVMVVGLIWVALLIPRDAVYEIWPRQRRIRKSDRNDRDEDS